MPNDNIAGFKEQYGPRFKAMSYFLQDKPNRKWKGSMFTLDTDISIFP